ncbi:ThuA domain-containing protein [Verrucomicrobiaceae bacterium 227]
MNLFPTLSLVSPLVWGGATAILMAAPANLEIVSIRDAPSAPGSMSLLFLGYQENNHHSPSAVFTALSPAFLAEGVQATFTSSLNSISESNLANYDALMMYGNALSSGAGSSNQPLVPILQQYVEGGGALAGLHVASAAFRNDLRFGTLLGGRLQSHTVGAFTPEHIDPNHPLIKNLPPLTSFDETYILKDLNPDIHVLQERVTTTGTRYAWTWTRSEGQGRVFYTASGHVPAGGDTSSYDCITKPEFSDLVLRGLHWTTRRHFSDLSGVSLGSEQSIWGEGTHRATGLGCLWQDNGTGPKLTMVQDDAITVGSETFFFGAVEPNTTIPCPNSTNSAVAFRSIRDGADQSYPGLWKLASEVPPQALALAGQPFPTSSSPELVERVGPIIGQDFVANAGGDSLFRIGLINPGTSEERSVIATGNSGIILSEGDLIPDLGGPVEMGNLAEGQLALNEQNNFACGVTLADNSKALVVSYGGALSLLAIENTGFPGLPGIHWGTPQNFSLNNAHELVFTTTLGGSVNQNNDTAVVRYSLVNQQLTILLREGDGVLETNFIGDLAASECLLSQNGRVHLFTKITGPTVTGANDQVLLSVGPETNIVVREGDPLPTFPNGNTMGPELGTSPLVSDETGALYFVADVLSGGISRSQLFQAIDATLFGVIGTGEVITNGLGTPFELSSIQPFTHSGMAGGAPSPAGDGSLVVIAETTGGHQILFKMGSLLDLDQDGLSNVLEAGLGADPHDPAVNHQFLPKIEIKGGEKFYTFLHTTENGRPAPTLQTSANLELWRSISLSLELWEDQSQVPEGFEKFGVLLGQEDLNSLFLRLAF